MPLLDKLKQELDRAGRAAQEVFDEGKTRLEAFRGRQLADKAAQALGYAVYRAKKGGASELDAETYTRLSGTLETHDTDAARLEAEIERRRRETAARSSGSAATGPVSSPDSNRGSPR